MTERLADRKNLIRICRLAGFFVFPAAAFYLMEAFEHNPFAEVRSTAQFFNIVLFELIAWILALLVARPDIAVRAELIAALAFGLTNHYVMLFRSTPFVPWDIFSVKTAASVAGGYDFTPDGRTIAVTLAFAALFAAAGLLKDRDRKKEKNRDGARAKLAVRLPAAAALFAVLCLFTGALQNEAFQIRNYLYPYLFTPVYMTKVNGMAVTFAMNLAYIAVDKPAGYDAGEAKTVLDSYDTDTEQLQQQDYPNIIVVMNEAFSDPAVLGDFETNEDYMPFFHALQRETKNTVSGYVQVSVCGGNTANSEFEFLTGNTMAFLPAGSIPYQQYIKSETPSLASHLKSLGYQTCAQHPYYANGWEREKVYPLLGFDDADFIGDYTEAAMLRSYVSDASDVRHLIRTFEKKGEGPLFLFNVTMQNHGGYTDEYDNFVSDVQADCGTGALNQYLSLLKRTDESLKTLVEYFAQVEEKTLIVFFGDHQPGDSVVRPIWLANGVDPSNLTKEQQRLRYQVPYVIWANYDIDDGAGADMSLNYLGADVLRRADVPPDGYRRFLLKLQAECPVIAASENPKEAAEKGGVKEMLEMYRRLQYYQLFDYRNAGEQ